ncbi:adipoR/hemolysin-III-related protein [Chloropicon primus]|uniref:AdipoR/hemolysin-III-related protein n=1 Tax=Chloropicon primus TaxID=1764295 RepID=A0A5B8MML2_9CHLO|nr:adipoR/hemolysin-III-related protein [Chloropicon primus]UPR00498.1 adipoR/hemolysin-III-related protein [Chloropicon primus]|mmetsp:Transcript_414/g.1184  ORF Transcript_414/g.1184 Transcript_414/m.1184 type:complete len:482 (+) Transcript_414:449-1894(+)|eukprot:QDZ21284.1 adipoR/hemolysin-III-related protein [Chloropicon primus]
MAVTRRQKAREGRREEEAKAIDGDEDAMLAARSMPARPRRKKGGTLGGNILRSIRARVTGGRYEKDGVPRYLIFNQYVLSGYRVNFTVKDSLMSLFTLHNESINIWTHAFGFVLFFALLIALCYSPPIMEVNQGSRNGTSADHRPPEALDPPASSSLVQASKDAAALYTESILLLNMARKQLGKALHLEEARDHLRKILTDVESTVFKKDKKHSFQLRGKFRETLKYLQKELKRRNVGKNLHVEEVKGKLLDLETHLRATISKNFKVEYWPAFLYLLGAMFCMLSSSMAHTFSICSPLANKWWWRIDYVGIAVMIAGSFCPVVYYTFLNEVMWRNFYLAVILGLGGLVAGVSLLDRFQEDNYRVFRALLFVAFGLFAVFPIVHATLLHWNDELSLGPLYKIFGYEVSMGAMYLGGALVYATQFPECMFPGKFDIFFNSHQVFHVAIVFAAYTHYLAVMEAIEWRYGAQGAQLLSDVNFSSA